MSKQPSNSSEREVPLFLQFLVLLALEIMGSKLIQIPDLSPPWVCLTSIGLVITIALSSIPIRFQGPITNPDMKNFAIAVCIIGLIFYCVAIFQFNTGSTSLTWRILGNLGALIGYGVFSNYMEKRALYYRFCDFFKTLLARFLMMAYGVLAILHLLSLIGILKNLATI